MSALRVEDIDWREHAACADADKSVFFPRTSTAAATVPAKAICMICPVLEDCRIDCDIAEGNTSPSMLFGIFALESPTERYERRQGTSSPPSKRAVKAARAVERAFAVFRGQERLHDATVEHFPDRPGPGAGFDAPQTCRITGCSTRQLRYWDQIGIVKPSVQSSEGVAGRRRLYSRADLDRLIEVRAWVLTGHRPADFGRSA